MTAPHSVAQDLGPSDCSEHQPDSTPLEVLTTLRELVRAGFTVETDGMWVYGRGPRELIPAAEALVTAHKSVVIRLLGSRFNGPVTGHPTLRMRVPATSEPVVATALRLLRKYTGRAEATLTFIHSDGTRSVATYGCTPAPSLRRRLGMLLADHAMGGRPNHDTHHH